MSQAEECPARRWVSKAYPSSLIHLSCVSLSRGEQTQLGAHSSRLCDLGGAGSGRTPQERRCEASERRDSPDEHHSESPGPGGGRRQGESLDLCSTEAIFHFHIQASSRSKTNLSLVGWSKLLDYSIHPHPLEHSNTHPVYRSRSFPPPPLLLSLSLSLALLLCENRQLSVHRSTEPQRDGAALSAATFEWKWKWKWKWESSR